MKAIIVGAGIIGLTSAWYLKKAGYDVTILEKNAGPSLGASYANGGMLSVGHSAPNNKPGILKTVWENLFSKTPFMKVKPDFSFHQTRWGIQSLLQATPDNFTENQVRMLNLAKLSRGALYEILAEHPIEFDHKKGGIMQLCQTESAVEAAYNQQAMLERHDIRATVLTPEEVVQQEPALKFAEKSIAGGIILNDEESGDSRKFALALADILEKMGVEFIYNCEVERILIEESSRQIRAVTSGETFYHGDQYLFTVGTESYSVLKDLLYLPIYPVKGYSLTFKVNNPEKAPLYSLFDTTENVAMTRFDDRVRVAGYAGVEGFNQALNPKEIAPIAENYRAWFPEGTEFEPIETWAGFRPMTPDGTPIISATNYPNLFINAGHGTFGWTMSTGSAKLIAEIMQAAPTSLNSYDYSLSRRI